MKHSMTICIGALMKNFKNGYDISSRMEGSLSPKYQLAVAAIALGMGLTGIYKMLHDGISILRLLQQNDSSQTVYYVGGLHNIGNNCFLNVVLQALASCNHFFVYLKNVLESESLFHSDSSIELPLTIAVSSLLEELRNFGVEKTVVHPQNVMQALSSYVSSFNLSRQQDAAEAFLHVISSLRDELLLSYMPRTSSIANALFPSLKVHSENIGGQTEYQRWKETLLGPFGGTIGSCLSCRNCSTVLSMDFEQFFCLPLSPVLDEDGDIMNGCDLKDCLNHFTSIELLDNYRCDRCWHISAVRYATLKSTFHEEKIGKLRCCVNYDACGCRSMFGPDEVPWHGSSSAMKQLTITSCPKILCLHLQRALMNKNEEFIKHDGHISFPLQLDLSPFTETSFQIRMNQQPNRQCSSVQRRVQSYKEPMLLHLSSFIKGIDTSFAALRPSNILDTIDDNSDYAVHATGEVSGFDDYSHQIHHEKNCPSGTAISSSSKKCVYRLAAVVEHYGRHWGGHYAVYRRVSLDSLGLACAPGGSGGDSWFYISDSHVSQTSEEAVLAAEASLLFYELL